MPAPRVRRTPTGPRSICSTPTLEHLAPSPVVTLNRAVAVAKVRGAEAALAMIEPLEPRLVRIFPFFGAKGGLMLQLGRTEEARLAFDRAIALANTPAEASHIRMHLDRLMRDNGAGAAAPGASAADPHSSRRASRVISIATRNPVDLE